MKEMNRFRNLFWLEAYQDATDAENSEQYCEMQKWEKDRRIDGTGRRTRWPVVDPEFSMGTSS